MTKKRYHISGFDCPNCAHKSESHLAKQDGIEECHIDFSTNKMYITFKGDALSVEEIAKLNPDAIILSPGPGKPENAGICIDGKYINWP